MYVSIASHGAAGTWLNGPAYRYKDAMATIRRVPSLEHNFQLVITRVYEEGDQELLEDEDESACVAFMRSESPTVLTPPAADEERVFLISEELEFRTGENAEGEPVFIWQDIEGDINEFYEFVASGTNAPTRAFFETCMYRAMYERKYRRGADNTTDEDLAQFIYTCVISELYRAIVPGRDSQ